MPGSGTRPFGRSTHRSGQPVSAPGKSPGGAGAQLPGRLPARAQGGIDGSAGYAEAVLEDLGGTARCGVGPRRASCSAATRGVNTDARSNLHSHLDSVLRGRLDVCKGLRPPLEDSMDYVIALIVAVGLGVYLFYALLRPERF